jgi:hypothetical protein
VPGRKLLAPEDIDAQPAVHDSLVISKVIRVENKAVDRRSTESNRTDENPHTQPRALDSCLKVSVIVPEFRE